MTYVIFGLIIVLIVTPLLGLLLRNFPSEIGKEAYGEKQAEVVKSGVDYAVAIKSPAFFALIIFALLMISVSTLNLFIPTYVTSVGFTVEQSSFVASAIMLGVTIGKVALGLINDRSGKLGVWAFSLLGTLGFIFLLLGKTEIVLMTLGGFLYGWAYAAVTVETALLVRTVFGSRDYAKIFSNISIALSAGGAIMSGGWGYLIGFISFDIMLLIGMGLVLISGLIGVSSIQSSKKMKL